MTLVNAILLGLAWIGLGMLAWRQCRHARRLEFLESHAFRPSRPTPTAPRVDPAPTLISVPNLAAPDAPTADLAAAASTLAARHSAVWELAEEGMSTPAIALETGLPAGQVELILSLRPPRVAPGRRPRRA